MSKTLEQFEQYLDKMKKYEHINTLLYWDMRTCAPKLGQAGHIDALTYFSTKGKGIRRCQQLARRSSGTSGKRCDFSPFLC